MSSKLKKYWRRLRSHYWGSLLFDVSAILLLFFVISQWQSRQLLPADDDSLAPDFQLQALASTETLRLSDFRGGKTVIYFFAPWCQVCNASIGNLQQLHEQLGGDELKVLAVAMDYADEQEVQQFSQRHQLTMPVLLGDWRLIEQYRLKGYPTYYVIDARGRVESRSSGYSTAAGLRWRSG